MIFDKIGSILESVWSVVTETGKYIKDNPKESAAIAASGAVIAKTMSDLFKDKPATRSSTGTKTSGSTVVNVYVNGEKKKVDTIQA